MTRSIKTSPLREFGIPAVALVAFFALQAGGTLTELELSFFIIALSALLFYWNSRLSEIYLFGVGVIVGVLLEVGFRLLGYQQSWLDANLFGVPFWLPIAWGMGFVVITRVGVYIRGITFDD